jgi:hypothetical protein
MSFLKILNQFGKPDVIAGVATGAGIESREYSLRPEAKHGRQNQVEGFCKKDKQSLLKI